METILSLYVFFLKQQPSDYIVDRKRVTPEMLNLMELNQKVVLSSDVIFLLKHFLPSPIQRTNCSLEEDRQVERGYTCMSDGPFPAVLRRAASACR